MVLVTRKYLAMRKGDVYYEYRCIEETHSKIFWEAWGRNHVQSFCAGRQFQCLWELSFTEKINGVGIKLLMTKGLWNKSLKREGYRISNGWYGNPFFLCSVSLHRESMKSSCFCQLIRVFGYRDSIDFKVKYRLIRIFASAYGLNGGRR